MTRRTTLSPREYRLLTAYLDDELSPRARARVEARLQKDATWQKALEETRALKAALRQLPRTHAPRAFTLTPAQAASVRRPRRQVPQMAYRWASALAALMFVVLLVGRGLAGMRLGSTAALPPQDLNMAAPQEVFSEAKAASEEAMPAAALQGENSDAAEETAKTDAVEAPQEEARAAPTLMPTPTTRAAPTESRPEPRPAPRSSSGWAWYVMLGVLLTGAIVLGWAGWRR